MQNPFLRGMLGSQQASQQQQLGQIQAMGGLLSLQNQQRQMAMDEQMGPLKLQMMQAQVGTAQNPAPTKIDLGGEFGLMDRSGNIVARIPKTTSPDTLARVNAPKLVDIPVQGQAGVSQPTWLSPGQTAGTSVGGQKMPEILNPDVFKARASLAHASRPQVNNTILPPQKTFENEDKLRADYSGNPLVKASSEMQNAFNLIDAAYKRPSAANDLAMATKYMKILDPTSVVRESEFALAVNATGLLDKVQNYSASILEGKKLNPNQRKDFYESAKAINDAFQKQRGDVDSQYSEMATGYGLNPKNVIPSLRKRRRSSDLLEDADAIINGGK